MNNLSWFKPWTSLRDLPGTARRVGDNIYNIGPSAFTYAVEYNKEFIEDGNGPYATILIFSPSAGAIDRSLNNLTEMDTLDSLNFSHIPDIGISGWSYKSLSKLPGALESAKFHGFTGQFVEISLEWGDFKFCFRERNLQAAEVPYLVQYSPKA
ncbi:hypothetical protein [Atopomonas hussainii]|uniref:hypothetical protein n=1 Tax=Atopomonas hussainii TaxID=1429083 RepID=UPI00090031F0|nr:hypothetical protein [Atopomonas hussainii]